MKPIKIIFLSILFLSFISCSSLPRPQMNPDEPFLKVVTYNINWGGRGWKLIGDYLEKADADIIFLQETQDEWEEYLKLRLSHKYPYSEFRHYSGAGGIAFMSKYKLSNVKVIKPENGWFPALTADIETKIGKVRLLNVHLRPPLSENGSATVSALYNSPEIHQKELKQFITETGKSFPLIIAGDFNEHEKGRGLQFLFENGFTDALSLYDQNSDTWIWELGYGLQLDDRYDHLIFNKHLKCTGAEVFHINNASDHMPVTGVFVINK